MRDKIEHPVSVITADIAMLVDVDVLQGLLEVLDDITSYRSRIHRIEGLRNGDIRKLELFLRDVEQLPVSRVKIGQPQHRPETGMVQVGELDTQELWRVWCLFVSVQ